MPCPPPGGPSQPRDWAQVSHIAGGFVTSEPPGKPKDSRVGSLFLLQGIFPTQELNQGLLHSRQILYQLSHQGSLLVPCSIQQVLVIQFIYSIVLKLLVYPFSHFGSLKLISLSSLVAQTVKRLPVQCRRPGFDHWVGKIPWRMKWHPTLVLLPGESHGWRSLVSYSPQGRKESDTTERLHFTYYVIEGTVIQLQEL